MNTNSETPAKQLSHSTELYILNENQQERLSECVSRVLTTYFKDMENHFNGNLYDLIISEVEKPLIEKVLEYTNNNQSNAASILGISRGTLRKKINVYNLNME